MSALHGLDNIDWETVGYHLPSLFPKRYDIEYILIHFITKSDGSNIGAAIGAKAVTTTFLGKTMQLLSWPGVSPKETWRHDDDKQIAVLLTAGCASWQGQPRYNDAAFLVLKAFTVAWSLAAHRHRLTV